VSQAEGGVAAPTAEASGWSEIVGFAVLTAVLVVAPAAVYPFFLMQALMFALFAGAFNLLLGYAGLLSFGHAMFLGAGGYVSAYVATVLGADPALAVLAGAAAAAVLGIVTGALAIRRQGIYFAMVTLALAQMFYFFCVEAPFTHGEDGIQGVPRGRLFGLIDLSHEVTLYYVVLAVFVAGWLLIYRTVNSPFGEILKAIRENEPRALSLGYRPARFKLAVFVLSATLAGVAGAVKAIVAQNASLSDVHWTTSGEVVLMTLVGGLGTGLGPVLGAFIVVAMQTYLAAFGQWVLVVQGAIFVVCVLAFRRGIVGEIARILKVQL
jgi:branched-chain amino acid transport system permease protein